MTKLPKSWQPPKALPKKINDCIDLFVDAYQERKRREASMNEVKKEEDRIEEHIIGVFGREDINGARGKRGSVTLQEKDVPKIVDYEAFCKWVKSQDAWDCFQQRPGERAIQARWEAGVEVPGIEKLHRKSVRLNETK